MSTDQQPNASDNDNAHRFDETGVVIQFDHAGGFWLVQRGDEHFVSTGLARAKAHARAVFGQAAEGDHVKIVIDPSIDALIIFAQHTRPPENERAMEALVDAVYRREIPLGAHDIAEVIGCTTDVIHRLFDERCADDDPALREPTDQLPNTQKPERAAQ